MQLDNQKTILNFNIRRIVVLLIFVGIVIFILLTNYLNGVILNLSKKELALFVVGIYLVYAFYNYYLNINYIVFTTSNKKITLRYSSVRPSDSKRNAIEIPLKNFKSYKIQKEFFGLKKNLILYVITKTGVAKYPPVSISSLSDEEIKRIAFELDKHVQ